MKNIYNCMSCHRIIKFIFEADGMRCPFCNGSIIPAAIERVTRKSMKKIKKN